MIGTKKLGCKTASKTVNAKKTVSPRNPLTVLNTPSIPSLHASSENKRRECFRIIHPNLSSKEGSSMRSKCQPRTPYSGPPSPISRSKCPPSIDPSSIRKKSLPKPISENPQNLRPWKPVKLKTSDLCSISKELASGKVTEPDRNFNVDLSDEKESCVVSTSERSFTPEGVKRCSIETDGKQHFSATPQSNSTPPIQASISPEVPCAFSVPPSPVCFATGHVMAGVQDRRRCRPRGILTIDAEHMKVSSSGPPPLSDASVCWFSSPLEISKENYANASNPNAQTIEFLNEASVNWLLSPSEFVEKEIEAGSVHAKSPNSDAIVVGENAPWYRISSVLKTPTTDSSVLKTPTTDSSVLKTPTTDISVLKTPTTDSSVSPFSVIVQRVESSSGLQILSSHKKDGQHRYDNALDTSPSVEKSWSNCSVVSAPSSYSSSRRYGVISPYEIDSVAEDVGAMSLLSKQVLGDSNSQNDISPSHSLHFEFCCQPTPLDSVDLNCFKNSRYNELSKVEIRDMNLSAMNPKISWRDGLLSRIFEMGELESYHSLFDDGEDVYCSTDDNIKSEFGFKCFFENGNGFGSYEFLVDNGIDGIRKCQSKAPLLEPTSLAESFYTEGGIISSSDSDWTLFYKNSLFEV